jgi:hypothetical protein
MRDVMVLMIAAIILCSSAMAYDTPVALIQERDNTVLSISLNQVIGRIDNTGMTKAWVFFTDKGFSTFAEYDSRLDLVAQSLTERAKTRRLTARGANNLVDFYDIPVNQNYIDQVLATGVKLRRVLKWFNAVTIEATADQLEQISRLPFVMKFKPVVSHNISDDFDKARRAIISFP